MPNRFQLLHTELDSYSSEGDGRAVEHQSNMVPTPPQKREVVIVGDSILRGVDHTVCSSDKETRMVSCLPGAQVADLPKLVDGLLIRKFNMWLKELEQMPVYHPTPSQTRLATQLTEEEQVRIAQRIGLIQHLPKGVYDAGRDGSEKKIRECVICMMDFIYGDPIRFLPCMHIYHMDCIDDWLMRSFTCPSCMEPVDAALLSSYETN
ncbi:RNF11 protein, partial [Amia calva]|nr:RNF11 protein [Amia calva]